MICPKCGNKIADNVLFCNKCGFKVMNSSPADGPTDTLRRDSQNLIQDNRMGQFQGVGSGPIQGGQRPAVMPPYVAPLDPESQKKSLLVPIIISSFVLLALIISIIVVLLKNKDEDNPATASISSDPTVSTTADSEEEKITEAPKPTVETLVPEDFEIFTIKDGMFFFDGTLFGKSYDEIRDYVESLGYTFSQDDEIPWPYGSEENMTARAVDVDEEHVLGFYFQDHKLVAATYEQKGAGEIDSSIAVNAERAFGKCMKLTGDDKKPYQIYSRYEADNPNVRDNKGGSYAVFLNPYSNMDHVTQQYMSDRFTGTYIIANYTCVTE